MITITILGMDTYLLEQVSKALTDKLACLYEYDKDKINFFAPEGSLVHDGVEQNTWNIIIKVEAPIKVKPLEKQALALLHEYTKNLCINSNVMFTYYTSETIYEFINDDYPRFMTEENSVYIDDENELDSEDECSCGDECCHHDHCHGDNCSCNDDEEIYLGDAFEEFNKRMGND